MTLPAPATVPPMRLLFDSRPMSSPPITTPYVCPWPGGLEGRGIVPVRSVPMRLPWTLLLLTAAQPQLIKATPLSTLPETRLPAPGAVPPTVLLLPATIATPTKLENQRLPVGVVPM